MTDGVVRRITWRSSDVARVLTLGLLFLFLWKFFWMVYSTLFLALLAVLIAIVIHLPARRLSRWMPWRVAFPLVVVLFVGGIVSLMFVVIPQLVQQATQLATQLPGVLDGVADWYRSKTGAPMDAETARSLSSQAAEFIGRFVPLAYNAIGAALGSFAILVLAVFLAAEPRIYRDMLLSLTPRESRHRWERAYDEAGLSLRAWVIGKAATMLLVGLATWVGLSLFGVPGALALAAFAALMEFIPNFGPTIAAAPAVAAGFAISPNTALGVAVFYFVLQQVQNAITVPLVERKAVNIPPAALLLWQLMLAVGFGVLALFVATPLLAVLVVAVRVLYVEPGEERLAWDRRDAGDPVPDAGTGGS
jgi:predicted PurR-regulated permease PerM